MRQVERSDVSGMIEHGAQLCGEQLDLVFAQVEAGEAGDVDHVVATRGLGHRSRGRQDTAHERHGRASISSLSQSRVATW